MTDWTVRRWTRYGHERLYAETPGGTALGYLDLKTGRLHSDDLSNLPILERAVTDYLAAQSDPAPVEALASAGGVAPEVTTTVVEQAQPEPEVVVMPTVLAVPPEVVVADAPEPSEPAWTDLSGVRAGAAAREQAIAEREAQGRVRHVLARLLGVKTDERAWRIGADAEEAVAEQLARLGPDWRSLHAVRVGDRGSDIDHVVIGPGGVFTVNAKHHPQASVWVGGDTFLVNGARVPYVRNSRHEARRAARLLTEHVGFPVQVVGIVAVMGAHRGFTVKKQPEDGAVVVVQRKRISQLLREQPLRLNAREISSIHEVARRSSTWR